MFFQFELADREEDLWSSSSPEPSEGAFHLFPSPAAPIHHNDYADPPYYSSSSSSSSSSSNSAPASSSTSTSPATSESPQPRQTTALEWEAAARDSRDGVQYTRERFPSDAISFLAPMFAREPVQVEEGERVVVLDEVSEFAVRVRVLRTGAVGVVPAWNVEGALERLARLNMMFNEVATCPKEIRRDTSINDTTTDAALSSLTADMHVHDHCISEPRLRLAFDQPSLTRERTPSSSPSRSDADMDMDLDVLATPTTPPDHAPPHAPPPHAKNKKRKAVEFATSPQRTIFRYLPAPDELDELEGAGEAPPENNNLWSDGEDSESGDEREDGQWWWDGWEESEDVSEKLKSAAESEDEAEKDGDRDSLRPGRSRVRRTRQAFMM